MTAEAKSEQARAAHEAARGRTLSLKEKIARSVTVEAKAKAGLVPISHGESAMVNWLTSRGIPYVLQKSVWFYNGDIAISDNFAIEVFGGAWHSVEPRRVHEAARLEHLLSRGWNILYVWNTSYMPICEVCADQAVSLLELTSQNPASRGKYWVVRGDGKLTTSASDDPDERAFILPSQSSK